MPTLAARDIADLVQGQLDNLGRMKFQQIAQTLQRYEVMGKWFKDDRETIRGSTGVKRNLMLDSAGESPHVGLYDTVVVNISDLLSQMDVPFRHVRDYYGFDRTEVLMNKGEGFVLDILKPRRALCTLKIANALEHKAWACPSVSNTTEPYGIPYYIVKHASTGFNGGAPSGHTTVAGINPTTKANWKNYTVQYAAVSKADLIKKLRTMHRMLDWRSPVDVQDYRSGEGAQKMRCYVNESLMASLEDVGEGSNENLGRDLAPYGGARDVGYIDGALTFRHHPIIWVKKLDDDTQNPFYMIDHSTFHPFVLEGDYLRESEPMNDRDQPDVFVVHMHMSYNYLCVDRRRNGVAATA